MYKIFWKGVDYELPVTDEEWTQFVLGNGDDIVAEICDLIDAVDIHKPERWHIITRFNNWLLLNQDKVEYSASWDGYQVTLKHCPSLVYCVLKDVDQEESANDFILWQKAREELSTK
tara:strand:- start:147 stop:497 length:351 start_codon:yes stop_codon:yes gene_type:complete